MTRGTEKLGTSASGCRAFSWVFKRRWGEIKRRKWISGAERAQVETRRVRRGAGCPQGKGREKLFIHRQEASARSLQPTGREVAEGEAKENENNQSSVPTTGAHNSGIFVILLGGWFVFIFWENQAVADRGSLWLCLLGLGQTCGLHGVPRPEALQAAFTGFARPARPFMPASCFPSHLFVVYVALLCFMVPCEWLYPLSGTSRVHILK